MCCLLLLELNVIDLCFIADDLRFASATSLALAVLFLVITGAIVVTKFFSGGLMKPKLLPSFTDLSSVLKLFTVVPVLVNAFICHSNGNNNYSKHASFSAMCTRTHVFMVLDVISPQYTERASRLHSDQTCCAISAYHVLLCLHSDKLVRIPLVR